jgi:hypothetical protein
MGPRCWGLDVGASVSEPRCWGFDVEASVLGPRCWSPDGPPVPLWLPAGVVSVPTLLFPGKTLQEVLPHLKEARRSVEEAVFTLRSWRRSRKKPVDPGAWRGARKQGPKRLSVTVSIGVADSTGRDPSPEAVLKKADQALYRAKKAGRNRVVK